MGLDIRLPIGLMFLVLGALLAAYGAFTPAGLYHRSLGINVNLWWGLVLALFGVVMTFLGQRGSRSS